MFIHGVRWDEMEVNLDGFVVKEGVEGWVGWVYKNALLWEKGYSDRSLP